MLEQLKSVHGDQKRITERTLPDTVASIPVDRLNLPVRIEHKLISNGILTLGEITNVAHVDFRTIRDFGPKSIEQVIKTVQNYIPGWEPKSDTVQPSEELIQE